MSQWPPVCLSSEFWSLSSNTNQALSKEMINSLSAWVLCLFSLYIQVELCQSIRLCQNFLKENHLIWIISHLCLPYPSERALGVFSKGATLFDEYLCLAAKVTLRWNRIKIVWIQFPLLLDHFWWRHETLSFSSVGVQVCLWEIFSVGLSGEVGVSWQMGPYKVVSQ